jgi:metal-sulfur cluster biosynthetic enzyme
VIKKENVVVDTDSETIMVHFTPTIPHCSMATLIGLCIRVKLLRSLPQRFKVDIKITPGTHNSEQAGMWQDLKTTNISLTISE